MMEDTDRIATRMILIQMPAHIINHKIQEVIILLMVAHMCILKIMCTQQLIDPMILELSNSHQTMLMHKVQLNLHHKVNNLLPKIDSNILIHITNITLIIATIQDMDNTGIITTINTHIKILILLLILTTQLIQLLKLSIFLMPIILQLSKACKIYLDLIPL
jgi:hypothetical protein